jgi:DNA-binding NarL/FixJ family response regulator
MLAELRERHPGISVVMLSASNDRDDITRALELGALGFIPKSAEREVMLSAFKLIFSGGIYVPPEILAPARNRRPRPRPLLSSGRPRPPNLASPSGRWRCSR